MENFSLITFLTSTVIASLITSLFTLYNAIQTNKRLFDIEKIKNNYSLKTFQYTKLYDLYIEVANLAEIDSNYLELKDGQLVQSKELLIQVITNLKNRFYLINSVFRRAKVILSSDVINKINSLFDEEIKENEKLQTALYTGGKADWTTLVSLRVKIQKEMIQLLEENIRELLNLSDELSA